MNKIYNPADLELESFKQVAHRISVNLGTNSCRVWDTWAVADSLGDIYGRSLLEVGAWNTFSCAYFASRGAEVHATDSFDWAKRAYAELLPPEMTPEAWEREATCFGGVTTAKLDITQLRVENQYDGVYAISTMEHIPNDLAGFQAIWRALKPGGIFAWTTEFNPFMGTGYIGEPYCYRVYNLRDIAQLLAITNFQLVGDLDLTMSPETIKRLFLPLAKGGYPEQLLPDQFTQISLAFRKPELTVCAS